MITASPLITTPSPFTSLLTHSSTMTVGNGTTPAAAETAVRITGKATVLPSKMSAHPPCPLVTFDLPYITFYYNQKLLLYKLDGADVDFPGAVGRLKDGLAAALVDFYPLAGRLAKDAEGALMVDCDEESVVGAEVIEAAAEGVAVADLAEGEGDVRVLQELVPYTGVMNLEGLRRPLLAVQFTKLKDGIAVGCAFNHAILDGTSTWHFMTSWSAASRGGGGAAAVPPPHHNRLAVRSVRVNLDGVLPASPESHEKADPNGPPKPLVARVFAFPAAAVSRLKSTANTSLPDAVKPLSTFQSLSAHVWRAVTRARRLPPDAVTVFAIFADCRRRVDPPMPEGYFGNLIQAVFTGTAAGLLLCSPPELVAGLLQAAIEGHDAAAIGRRLEEYEGKPKMFYYTDAGMNCVAVGSSPRFRVYDVDFGFGRPERVRSGSNNKFDGMIFLYPGRDGDGSIDVELTLDGEAMQNLEKDEGFLNVEVA